MVSDSSLEEEGEKVPCWGERGELGQGRWFLCLVEGQCPRIRPPVFFFPSSVHSVDWEEVAMVS